ncbi:MAG: hypothetical protein GY706_06120 [Bacteroides sp.]|nr:hypothetical protein [Bacteroides sp.]
MPSEHIHPTFLEYVKRMMSLSHIKDARFIWKIKADHGALFIRIGSNQPIDLLDFTSATDANTEHALAVFLITKLYDIVTDFYFFFEKGRLSVSIQSSMIAKRATFLMSDINYALLNRHGKVEDMSKFFKMIPLSPGGKELFVEELKDFMTPSVYIDNRMAFETDRKRIGQIEAFNAIIYEIEDEAPQGVVDTIKTMLRNMAGEWYD